MKKLLSLLLTLLMVASLLTVTASAATSASPDNGKVLNAAYGTAVVDGKLDDAYLKGDKVTHWLHNTYNAWVDKKADVKTSFYAYLLYDENYLYAFGEVFDNTPNGKDFTKTNHTNDSLEFYFWLDDFTQCGENKLHNQVANPASGMFRIHAPYLCEDEAVCNTHMGSTNGMGLAVMGEMLKYQQKRTVTSTGYTVEIAVEIPAECKAAVQAGKQIGFGIQVNDAIDGVDARDALLWSNNNLGDPQKNGPMLLLAKDAAPATTAPETTAAPVTTAPATTPATADASMLVILAAALALSMTVVLRRRAK